MNQSAPSRSRTGALAALWLVAICVMAAGLVAAPLIYRVPLAVMFVLALRHVGARPALAEWTFLRLPALLLSSAIVAGVTYLAVYGLY